MNSNTSASRSRSRKGIVALIVAILCVLVGTAIFLDWYICLPEGIEPRYVGREACVSCHEQEDELWRGSDHDLAMDRANEKTVLGDFDDAHFTHIAFADIWRLPDHELQLLLKECSDNTLAVALLPFAPEEVSAALGSGQSGEKSREKILAVLPEQRRSEVQQLRDWREQFARPCDITTAHQEIGEIARALAAQNKLHPDFAVTSRMFRRDGEFYIETDNANGELEVFHVGYVFGIYPLQQYMVEFPDGRIQCLPVAWDTEKGQWFHLYPSEPIPAGDPLHWTGEYQNWNYMCAECHTTDLQKNYDLATDTYHTTWSEINVSCEACHGPGSLHVELSEANSLFWDRRYGYGLPEFDPADSKQMVESCAPCHSRRRVVAHGFRPGDKYLDHYVAEFLDNELYYADGQIKDEDYVYGSFLQSRMYREGVRCIDCHDPHSARIKFDDPHGPRTKYLDNKLCGQCHTPSIYDTPKHHFHPKTDEPGAFCVDCHMPETSYMVVDPRRDHSFQIPRPELTISLGIPNACNGCHQDPEKGETPEWAAQKVEEWYGKKSERRPHFAYAFQAAKEGDPRSIAGLLELLRATGNSGQVRGSAVLLLSRFGDEAARAGVLSALEDDDPLVRVATARAVRNLPHDLAYVDRVKTLLRDPNRAARVEVVPWLANFRDRSLGADYDRLLKKAIDEYIASQEVVADRAGSHVNLAVLYLALNQPQKAATQYQHAIRINPEFLPARNNLGLLYADLGRFGQAEEVFREALEIDPDFLPALDNLARLHYRQGNLARAESLFNELVEKAPEDGEVRFSLGLLLAEIPGRMEDAAAQLSEAARLMPQNARVHYNLGLVLQHLDRLSRAEAVLRRACELDPQDTQAQQALLLVLVEAEKWEQAQAMAERIHQRIPSPQTRAMLDAIRQHRDPRTPRPR